MIRIRSVNKNDLESIERIHKLYYPDLDMPDFNNMLSGFVIQDEDDEMIMAGGVEAIGEALLVTDKSKSRIKIGRALVEAQRFAMFTCANYRIRELYAFTENEDYKRHLKQHGFIERNEPVLRLKV